MFNDKIDHDIYVLCWYMLAAWVTYWVTIGDFIISIVAGTIVSAMMDKHWHKMYTTLNS